MNQKIWIKKKKRKKKERSLVLKFQLIPILCFQVMHDYVHWHCSIDDCANLSLVDETLCKKLLSFHKEMISALFLWGNVLLRGELQRDATNSYFDNFESALYSKSGSMPLKKLAKQYFFSKTLDLETNQHSNFWRCIVTDRQVSSTFDKLMSQVCCQKASGAQASY